MKHSVHSIIAVAALFGALAVDGVEGEEKTEGAARQEAPPPVQVAAKLETATTIQPERTLEEEAVVLQKGRISARQRSFARLAIHPDAAGAEALLKAQFARYRSHDLPPAVWLDLFEAMAKRGTPELKALLAERDAELAKLRDPLRRFEECLEGGNGEVGRTVFEKKPEAGCIRCHSVDAKGGKVGPELTWLRHNTERMHILESIILPDSTVATGFNSVALKLKNGETVVGIIRTETPTEITLGSFVDGKPTKVKLAKVEERTALPSPMPPIFGQALDKRTIRDLVQFIAEGD